MYTILTKNKVSSIWPGTDNAYNCTVLFEDNTRKDIDIPKAEVELTLYVSTLKSTVITDRVINKLKELIEDYGQECYEDAQSDAAIDAAGESI